jgi:hypothetical protein
VTDERVSMSELERTSRLRLLVDECVRLLTLASLPDMLLPHRRRDARLLNSVPPDGVALPVRDTRTLKRSQSLTGS